MTKETEKNLQLAGETLPMEANQVTAMQEVQGAIIVAQKCPRNENQAALSINDSCKRSSLAQKAMFAYPRGGKMVTGPSIRLAEVIARAWGNIKYGIREISSGNGETKYEAFAWDMQTNVKSTREFSQRHARYSKANGLKNVSDPRDIYEIVASQATRRMRACILQVIPIDVIEDAMEQCEKTLRTGSKKPIKDRIKNLILAFNDHQVNEEMIEARLGHKVGVTSEIELIDLGKIFASLRDGMSKREDWFSVVDKAEVDLNNKFSGKEKKDASIKDKL